MEEIYGRAKIVREDKASDFCPGCIHSIVIRLIGEMLEEVELMDYVTHALGVGCCGLYMDYIACDDAIVPHGRACAVATGAGRSNPGSLALTY